MKGALKKFNFWEILIYLAFLAFSIFLMWSTFRLNSEGNIEIASKVWSDFAATLPLIRSFSLGNNFPPQYPLFAGPSIRYHFVFFLAVGLLEKTGIPLDWALNLLSSLTFFTLLSGIYLIGKKVFSSMVVGLIAVILFLLNGSWGFIEFFKTHPLSVKILSDIIYNDKFSSFGPYDGNIISAFWSLNIYTNQRHLALAYASFIFLILLYWGWAKKPSKFTFAKALLLGIAVGLFPFIHMAVFGMLGIVLIVFLIIYPSLRKQTLVASITAILTSIPQLLYIGSSQTKSEFFDPGYLVENRTFAGYLTYWFMNLGLAPLLGAAGFWLAKREQRKILIPFIILFLVGNIFRFSPEIAANHKFFNLTMIGVNLFAAFFLTRLYLRGFLGKIFIVTIFPFLILTGFIDLFPIINDNLLTVKDIPHNKTAAFILNHTSKDAVFLNSDYLYDPASLAGRKIYLGWPYFSWSAGYDTNQRDKIMKNILSSKTKINACLLLIGEGLDYIALKDPTDLEDVEINYSLYRENFIQIYENEGRAIYDIKRSCL